MTTATFVICTMQMSVGICLQRLGVLLGAVPVGLGYLAIVAFPAGSTVAHTIQSFTIMLTTVFALFLARPGSAVQRDLTIYPSPPSLTTTAAHICLVGRVIALCSPVVYTSFSVGTGGTPCQLAVCTPESFIAPTPASGVLASLTPRPIWGCFGRQG